MDAAESNQFSFRNIHDLWKEGLCPAEGDTLISTVQKGPQITLMTRYNSHWRTGLRASPDYGERVSLQNRVSTQGTSAISVEVCTEHISSFHYGCPSSLGTQMNLTIAFGSLDDILIKVIIPRVNKYYIPDDFNGMQ